MKKIEQVFIEQEGKLVVQTIITEELSDTGCIYLALPKVVRKDSSHLVYKLHGFRDKNTVKYIWVGLWNSCSIKQPFGDKNGPHNSIQDAIQWVTKDKASGGGDHNVIKCHFSDLISEFNLKALYKKAQIQL